MCRRHFIDGPTLGMDSLRDRASRTFPMPAVGGRYQKVMMSSPSPGAARPADWCHEVNITPTAKRHDHRIGLTDEPSGASRAAADEIRDSAIWPILLMPTTRRHFWPSIACSIPILAARPVGSIIGMHIAIITRDRYSQCGTSAPGWCRLLK